MFQNFVTKHNSSQFTTKITKAVNPAALAPIINTPTVSRDNLFVDLTPAAVSATTGLAFVVAIDNFSHTDNQVISVAASLSSSAAHLVPVLVRFEVDPSTVPAAIPAYATMYPVEFSSNAGSLSVKDCVTVSTSARTGGRVYVGLLLISTAWTAGKVYGSIAVNQADHEITTLQPLK